MGEYIRLASGEQIKLGTCEDLYYARFEQVQIAAHSAEKLDGNDNPSAYLEEKYGWRYRFPFPDEDEIPIGHFDKFDRGYIVPVPYKFYNEDFDHRDICVSTSVNGSYNVNQYVKCPADKEWVKTCSDRESHAPLEIVQQKQVEGKLWLIARCGWCRSKYRLPLGKAIEMIEVLKESGEKYDRDYEKTIAKRILSGYGLNGKGGRA